MILWVQIYTFQTNLTSKKYTFQRFLGKKSEQELCSGEVFTIHSAKLKWGMG
jgi:hypothetical protein